MYKIVSSKQFRRDYKKLCRSGRFDVSILNKIINTLAQGEVLDKKYKDHVLKGSMESLHECHLKPDLLLVYKIYGERVVLELIRLGSHSELFA